MTIRIATIIYHACYWLGITHALVRANRRGTINVTYHNVLPDRLYDGTVHLGVSHPLSVFRRQVEVLQRHYTLTTRPDAPGQCRITFDDGYLNQKEVAAAELEAMGLAGVFFVPFAPLKTGRVLALDRVMLWISYCPAGGYVIVGRRFDLRDAATRLDCVRAIYAMLLADHILWRRIEEELDAQFAFARVDLPPDMAALRFSPMTEVDLAELRARGHRVACHGWDHLPLSCASAAELEAEFARCAVLVDRYCNSREFSYPFGTGAEVSRAVVESCRAHGFSRGYLNVCARPGWYSKDLNDFVLPRVALPSDEIRPAVILAKVCGLENFLRNVLLHWRQAVGAGRRAVAWMQPASAKAGLPLVPGRNPCRSARVGRTAQTWEKDHGRPSHDTSGGHVPD